MILFSLLPVTLAKIAVTGVTCLVIYFIFKHRLEKMTICFSEPGH